MTATRTRYSDACATAAPFRTDVSWAAPPAPPRVGTLAGARNPCASPVCTLAPPGSATPPPPARTLGLAGSAIRPPPANTLGPACANPPAPPARSQAPNRASAPSMPPSQTIAVANANKVPLPLAGTLGPAGNVRAGSGPGGKASIQFSAATRMSSEQRVDKQLELEAACDGVEHVGYVTAEAERHHSSELPAFRRMQWNNDPFYGWRTQDTSIKEVTLVYRGQTASMVIRPSQPVYVLYEAAASRFSLPAEAHAFKIFLHGTVLPPDAIASDVLPSGQWVKLTVIAGLHDDTDALSTNRSGVPRDGPASTSFRSVQSNAFSDVRDPGKYQTIADANQSERLPTDPLVDAADAGGVSGKTAAAIPETWWAWLTSAWGPADASTGPAVTSTAFTSTAPTEPLPLPDSGVLAPGWGQVPPRQLCRADLRRILEPQLKASGLDWEDLNDALLSRLEASGELRKAVQDPSLLPSIPRQLASWSATLAKKMHAANMRSTLEPELIQRGITWQDFVSPMSPGVEPVLQQLAMADLEKAVSRPDLLAQRIAELCARRTALHHTQLPRQNLDSRGVPPSVKQPDHQLLLRPLLAMWCGAQHGCTRPLAV
eukprot:TRINITY_DN57170_c0_g1_i1.p1 TRINITY_DN57170_c0_g1~~TRINITY_DN57170_c0_g1_i1.p1  ORF type:complete len:601 (+),score=75.10 TRINITY_DN57170_c0_g1_i1:147-1949(+)